MAQFVAKKIAKHVLKETAENNHGTNDPYFEHVSAVDVHGNSTGKLQKRKRAVPPGLTAKEERILKKVTRRAYRLDNCFNFCGIRIGVGAIVGIVPALGDIFDTLMALMVFRTCTQAELPASLRSRMLFNIVIDFAIGLLPLLGDVADALWRANTKNAYFETILTKFRSYLLHLHLKERGAARIAAGEKNGGAEPFHNDHTIAPTPARIDNRADAMPSQTPRQVCAANHAPKKPGKHEAFSQNNRPMGQSTPPTNNGSRGWLGRFANKHQGGGDRDLEQGELSELPPRH